MSDTLQSISRGSDDTRAFCMAGKVGLVSYGFTCFMNSVIQGLAHSEPLSMMIRGLPLNYSKHYGLVTLNEDEKFQRDEFAYLFQRVVRELWVDKRSVVKPSYLLRSLNRGWSLFDEDELDVHDVYLCIVESLHKALGVYTPTVLEAKLVRDVPEQWFPDGGCLFPYRSGDKGPGDDTDEDIEDDAGEDPTEKEHSRDDIARHATESRVKTRFDTSIRGHGATVEASKEHCESHFVKSLVTDTLQGVTLCQVKCACCGACTYTSEPFFSLSLDFPESCQPAEISRRRAMSVIQSKDSSGLSEARMSFAGDILESFSGNLPTSRDVADDTSKSLQGTGREHMNGSPPNDGSVPAASAVDESKESLRLHRATSSRAWCRRGNGIDSIRVPIPVPNPHRSIRNAANSSFRNLSRGGSSARDKSSKSVGSWFGSRMRVESEQEKEKITLDIMLNAHFRSSRIPSTRFRCNAAACESSISRGAKKSCGLINLPEVLVIHLRRGTFSPNLSTPSGDLSFQSKDDFVEFPLTGLDLGKHIAQSPWYKHDVAKTGLPLYDLHSVIVYNSSPGAPQGTHTNYSRHYDDLEAGAWYAFTDQQVKEVPVSHVRKAKASLLFYVKQVPLGPKFRDQQIQRAVHGSLVLPAAIVSPSGDSHMKKFGSHFMPTSPPSNRRTFNSPAANRRLTISSSMASSLQGVSVEAETARLTDQTKSETARILALTDMETTRISARTKFEKLRILREESMRMIEKHDDDILDSLIVHPVEEEDEPGLFTKMARGVTSLYRSIIGRHVVDDDMMKTLEKFKKSSAGLILGDKAKTSNLNRPIEIRRFDKIDAVDIGEKWKSDVSLAKMKRLIVTLMDKLDGVSGDKKDIGTCRLSTHEYHDPGGQPPEGYIIVSAYWLLKFRAFSDPGYPCNHDIACPHGALKPHLRGAGRHIFVPMRWGFFLEILSMLDELHGHSADLKDELENMTHFRIYSDVIRDPSDGDTSPVLERFRPIRELETCTACHRRQVMMFQRRRSEKEMVIQQRIVDHKKKLARKAGHMQEALHSQCQSSPPSPAAVDHMSTPVPMAPAGMPVPMPMLSDQHQSSFSTTASQEINTPELAQQPHALDKLYTSVLKRHLSGTDFSGLTDADDVWSTSSEEWFCYIVDKQWLDSWRAFVATDASEDLEYSTPPPGKISNGNLLLPGSDELKSGLKAGIAYEAVSPGVWYILHRIYGGQPVLPRRGPDIYSSQPQDSTPPSTP